MPKREWGSHNVCNYLSTLEAAGIAAVNPAAFLSEISSLKHDRALLSRIQSVAMSNNNRLMNLIATLFRAFRGGSNQQRNQQPSYPQQQQQQQFEGLRQKMLSMRGPLTRQVRDDTTVM